MGLDIYAYSNLVKLDCVFNEDNEPIDRNTGKPIDNYFKPHDNGDFPGRIEGLDANSAYSFADCQDVFSLSYSGYSTWRDELARLAGYPVTTNVMGHSSYAAGAWRRSCTGGPFYELINFSDCEGTIGPVVAKKLLRDFEEWDDRAKHFETTLLRFYEHYQRFLHGLEISADGGAIDFK